MTSRTAETLERGLAASMTAGGFVSRTIEVILYWRDLARGRRHLAALNDEMLRDIGLTRADVEREYRKPFGRADSFAMKSATLISLQGMPPTAA
jgi:uncharacterized protein YjiS (DUF1127 family)